MDKQSTNGVNAVNRIIPVTPLSEEKLQVAASVLRSQNAVIDAYIDKRGRLRDTYNASRIAMRDIKLVQDGLEISRDTAFWSRVKLAWFRSTDDNARDNVCAGSGACCNRPPVFTH